jgi:hypothetical protein
MAERHKGSCLKKFISLVLGCLKLALEKFTEKLHSSKLNLVNASEADSQRFI